MSWGRDTARRVVPVRYFMRPVVWPAIIYCAILSDALPLRYASAKRGLLRPHLFATADRMFAHLAGAEQRICKSLSRAEIT